MPGLKLLLGSSCSGVAPLSSKVFYKLCSPLFMAYIIKFREMIH